MRPIDELMGESLTMFCAWTERRPTGYPDDSPYTAGKVDLASEVDNFLRAAAAEAVAQVSQREHVAYTADAELEDDKVFLIEQPEVLAELSGFRALVDEASTVGRVDPRELPELRPKLYGVAVGDTAPRLGLIRKTNPVKVSTAGRLFASGHRRLAKLSDPLFQFDGKFDIVLGDTWAAILNQRQFELLLREAPTVRSHIEAWVDTIAAALPLSPASDDALRQAALRDSRLWRRLRNIHQRGHLATIDLNALIAYAERVGLDPDELVVDGQLEFAADDRFTIVKLLNEDLYSGGLTGERFEAHRKEPLAIA